MSKIRVSGFYAYRNGKRVHVKGHLRKDVGKPGRTPEVKRWYRPVGTLGGWRADMPMKARRRILVRLVHTPGQGYAKTIRKLNSLRNVSTSRLVDAVTKADMEFLRRKFRPEA